MDTLHVYFLCCCCYGSSSIPSKKLKILFEAQSEEKRLPNVTKRENCGKWKIQHEVLPQLGANREGGGEVRRHLWLLRWFISENVPSQLFSLCAGAQKSQDDSDSGWEITYKNLINSLTSYSWTFTEGSPSKGDDTIRGACRPYLATNSKRVFTSLVAGLRLEITEALKEASLHGYYPTFFFLSPNTQKFFAFSMPRKDFWSFKNETWIELRYSQCLRKNYSTLIVLWLRSFMLGLQPHENRKFSFCCEKVQNRFCFEFFSVCSSSCRNCFLTCFGDLKERDGDDKKMWKRKTERETEQKGVFFTSIHLPPSG